MDMEHFVLPQTKCWHVNTYVLPLGSLLQKPYHSCQRKNKQINQQTGCPTNNQLGQLGIEQTTS